MRPLTASPHTGQLALAFACAALATVVLAGCATKPVAPPAEKPSSGPSTTPPASSKLAPGLYDQPDGTVEAIGTLEWRDLEGGFWAIIDGTKAQGEKGEVAAVIANGQEFQIELEPLKGLAVTVRGKRLDGLSTRMAGPEIQMTSVEAAGDGAPDAAQ